MPFISNEEKIDIEDLMPALTVAVIAFIALVVVFTAVWAWQVKSKNAGMIDPIWAITLGVIAVLVAVLADGDLPTRIVIGIGGSVWGIRLGLHLWKRNAGHAEDPRYHKFREQWGADANKKMFWFFQVQVVISMLLSIAFFVPAYRVTPPGAAWVALAAVIWVISIAGEALADYQLRAFKADPSNHGAVCRAGLVALFTAPELLLRVRALGRVHSARDRRGSMDFRDAVAAHIHGVAFDEGLGRTLGRSGIG
jgi:steroid 5-alpha reductase family enzyme